MNLKDCGACFMAGLPSTTLDASTQELISQYGVNHFILFSRNIVDEQQVRRLCRDLISSCLEQGGEEPLIAIDQEGGTVARLKPPFWQFADARSYGTGDDPEQAVQVYSVDTSVMLKGLGFNVNFAPVLDVCPEGQGCFMEQRCLHGDADMVACLGAIIIDGFQGHGIAACAKHFPGLGEAVIDPHLHLPKMNDDLDKMRRWDLLPFKRSIEAGVAMVMTSHVQYDGIDRDHLATMSALILQDLLRTELGYDGVVVTDDLEMGAVKNHFGVAEAAVLSFQAGADLLLICENQQDVQAGVQLLFEQCQRGEVEWSQIYESKARIKKVCTCFARKHD